MFSLMRWMDQKDPLDLSGEISSGDGKIAYRYWEQGEAFRDYDFDFMSLMKRSILLFILFLKVCNNRMW